MIVCNWELICNFVGEGVDKNVHKRYSQTDRVHSLLFSLGQLDRIDAKTYFVFWLFAFLIICSFVMRGVSK